jgi:hypothetical protein
MEQIRKDQNPKKGASTTWQGILNGFSYLPFCILIVCISLYTLVSIFSAFQELPHKWLIVHSYLPKFIAYVLLVIHILLSPGEVLLLFSVFCMRMENKKSVFIIGFICLLYYPIRLFFLFTILAIFPIWLIFDTAEAFVLIRIYKSIKMKNKASIET